MQLELTLREKVGEVVIWLIVLGITVLICGPLVVSMWRSGQARFRQQELNQQISKTPAGKFAVDNFTACKQSGGLLASEVSDARCIIETVGGADKIKGGEFSAEVTRELASWIASSEKLKSK